MIRLEGGVVGSREMQQCSAKSSRLEGGVTDSRE
jgi:hypothetical protein